MLKRVDLHGHIIYQINQHAQLDFRVKVANLHHRRRRCHGRKRACRPHPGHQGPSCIVIMYIKMILMLSPTSWGRSRTYITNVADAGDKNVPVDSIPSPRNPPILSYYA